VRWLVGLAAVVASALAAAGAGAHERAVWTWEATSYDLVQNPAAADAAVGFARRQHLGIVYLYADAYGGRELLLTKPEAYRAFLRRLHHAGIRAYALLGSAFLHTEAYVLPEHRSEALTMVRRVLDFNAGGAPDERFDGINLDIEPHILDAWDQHKLELLAGFLDLSQAIMDLKHASGAALEVGPAIPFWWDGIELAWHGTTRSVAEHTLALYDYAALMDYRDHASGADGIISHARDEMQMAERLHKRIVIGVDITTSELQKLSFDHLTPADLERELELTEAAYAGSPAFAGFAIHHFAAYRDWLERQRPAR
jgi:hypothetical protein